MCPWLVLGFLEKMFCISVLLAIVCFNVQVHIRSKAKAKQTSQLLHSGQLYNVLARYHELKIFSDFIWALEHLPNN